MIIITTARIKAIVSGCRTEIDLDAELRHHKIKHYYSTDTGFTSIVVPCNTGKVRIYRTASRTNPFVVVPVKAENFHHKRLDFDYQM